MVFTILKSLNKKVGKSLVENDMLEESKEIFNLILDKGNNFFLTEPGPYDDWAICNDHQK